MAGPQSTSGVWSELEREVTVLHQKGCGHHELATETASERLRPQANGLVPSGLAIKLWTWRPANWRLNPMWSS
jgi:hypothetical protein